MNLTLVLIILMVIGAAISKVVSNPKVFYIVWCSFFLVLSVSLKSAYYGTANGGGADTTKYVEFYKDVIEMSFDEIWVQFVDRYFNGVDNEMDIGFLLLEWLFTRFTTSYHIFSTCVDLLFFIPFAMVINRYCNRVVEVFFAYLLYLAIFHNLALFGARQLYAMGFGLMFFLFHCDKRYKEAIICLLLGTTIHMSLLLVLIPFAVSYLPDRYIKTLHVFAIILIPVVLFVANPIIEFMGNAIGNERYANYGRGQMQGGVFTYVLLSEMLSIICLVLTNRECFVNDLKFKYIYSMAPVFTFFAPLIASNGSMMRITAYSQIFVSVLIPYLMSRRYGDEAKQYLTIAIIILSALMLKNGYEPYHFFWEVDPVYMW